MTLTLVEAISLAGDRDKQNDDAFGFLGSCAWVIDGATDLHDEPLSGWASDAAWLAHTLNGVLHFEMDRLEEEKFTHGELLVRFETAIKEVEGQFFALPKPLSRGEIERWREPIASMLLAAESADGVIGFDLGDCRCFALDADERAHAIGGPDDAADEESALAARQRDAEKPLLQRTETIAMLRRKRAGLNLPGSHWTVALTPACADNAREWSLALTRPAHILLMTDGFSALADRYRVHDAAGLVRAALSEGLHCLGRELRRIENEDAAGGKHPRFKKSDDATALLLRLT